MHVIEWHIFQFEKLENLSTRKLKLLFGLRPKMPDRPRVSPRAVSEPDQSILREHWVFIFPIIPVYNDTEDAGIIINWNSVVCLHIQNRVTHISPGSNPASALGSAGYLNICSL